MGQVRVLEKRMEEANHLLQFYNDRVAGTAVCRCVGNHANTCCCAMLPSARIHISKVTRSSHLRDVAY